MTNEKLYFEICEMLKCYDRETGRDYGGTDEWLQDVAAMRETAKYDGPNIYASAARVLLDLREKMDKKAAGAAVLNACKRIIKNSMREDLRGVFFADGYYNITDGYKAVRMKKDLASLPRSASKLALATVMPKKKDLPGDLLRVPSASEIKAWAAERGRTRAQKSKEAYTPEGWPQWIAVNPFYLLDMLEALPGCKIYNPGRAWAAIYFETEGGNDGILLPVRTPKAKAAWGAELDRREAVEQEARRARKMEIA